MTCAFFFYMFLHFKHTSVTAALTLGSFKFYLKWYLEENYMPLFLLQNQEGLLKHLTL